MLGRSSAKKSKAELRKSTNVAARAEHREQLTHDVGVLPCSGLPDRAAEVVDPEEDEEDAGVPLRPGGPA